MKLIITTIEQQPSDFKLFAQNMWTYELCGYTDQIGYKEVLDIPQGYSQRALPGHYGDYLTMVEITNFMMIENGQLEKLDAVTTELSAMEVDRVMEDYKEVIKNV